MRLTDFLATVFPHLTTFHLNSIKVDKQQITLSLSSYRRTARCPGCQTRSHRVHSRYVRTVHDLPVAGITLRLRITARRFYCRTATCQRRTFRERLPTVAPVYHRRTPLLHRQIERIGFAVGGRAGQRLLQELECGTPGSSRNSILRVVRQAALPAVPTPHVLGVDDWSFRCGRTYGTILTDLERHRPVDLLPDRSAQTLAQWLAEHGGVAVVTRDRAGAYADGVRQGAPAAIQIADQFHIMKNATDALEKVLVRQHRFLRLAAKDTQDAGTGGNEPNTSGVLPTGDAAVSLSPSPSTPRTRLEREQQARLDRKHARYEQVHTLQSQGYSYRAIAKQVGLSRETVTRLARSDWPPERRIQSRRPSILDPFEPYLRERWAQGEHNSAQLFVEIHEQGFPGSPVLVRQRLARWRLRPTLPQGGGGTASGSSQPKRGFSPRHTLWLLLNDTSATPCANGSTREEAYVARLREVSPTIQQAQESIGSFRRLLQTRDLAGFRAWLPQALRSTVPEVRGFARGLCRDRSAVEAAFVYAWNNGQVEGQVNRLKMLKRQTYGRANFDLLRRRVLYHAA